MIVNYVSTAKLEEIGDIVDLNIYISRKADTAKSAFDAISKIRTKIINYITNKAPDCKIVQGRISLEKVVKRENYYEKNGNQITEEMYLALPVLNRNEYILKIHEKFMYYSATSDITITLNVGNGIVNNIVSLFSMSAKEDFHCRYVCKLSDKLNTSCKTKLYSMCIEKGIHELTEVFKQTEGFTNAKIKLLEVNESTMPSSNFLMMEEASVRKTKTSGAYNEPEQIIMPEMIRDSLGAPIILTKTLTLKFDVVQFEVEV